MTTELDRIPIEVEDGEPVRVCVVYSRKLGEWCTAWAFDGGKRKVIFGAAHPSAWAAIRAARYLNEKSGNV
jgi:hypothetical protein